MSGHVQISTGAVVSLEDNSVNTVIMLRDANAPEDMREIEAGRIVCDGRGFQPAMFFPGALRPEVLRAIADLIETPNLNNDGENK